MASAGGFFLFCTDEVGGVLQIRFFAGYGEGQDPSAGGQDLDLLKEMDCLERFNKKLAEEKTSLQSEMAGLDDLVQMIKTENDNLKVKLKAQQHTLEIAAKFELECEDLKSDRSSIEERYVYVFVGRVLLLACLKPTRSIF